MAKGIEIGVGADTKAFKQGIETGVIQPIDDAAMALDDLGRNQGPEQLERSLEGAQDATEKLQRETKETADAIERDFRDAYRSTKTASDTATRGTKQNLNDIKSEARANAAETFASFDGSVEGFGDAVQGTLGGLVAALPGVGAAIAAAAAIGFGVIKGQTEKEAEAAEKRVDDMYGAFLESKTNFLSAAYLTDAVEALFGDEETMKKIQKQAEITGLSIADIGAAYAGDAQAIALVTGALDDAADSQVKLNGAGQDYNQSTVTSARAGQEELRKIAEATDTASDRAQAAIDTVDKYGQKWETADKNAAKTKETIESIGDKTPKEVKVKLSVDDKELVKALKKERVVDIVIGTVRNGKRAI